MFFITVSTNLKVIVLYKRWRFWILLSKQWKLALHFRSSRPLPVKFFISYMVQTRYGLSKPFSDKKNKKHKKSTNFYRDKKRNVLTGLKQAKKILL